MSISTRKMYNFGPAIQTEPTVYGASRPGYGRDIVSSRQVDAWTDFMSASGIQRVCCLLSAEQLGFYQDLLGVYRSCFGIEHICWAPVPDFQLADPAILCETILPYLASADEAKTPVVVHCSAGSGRTGHVLAAWLVFRYGMEPEHAAEMVVGTGRNPYEAEGRHEAGKRKLYDLLEMCR